MGFVNKKLGLYLPSLFTCQIAYDIICVHKGVENMKTELGKQAKKYMSTCNQKDYDKIDEVLTKLENFQDLHGKIKKLQGRIDEYRISIPPFRIIFKLDKFNKIIVITKIDTRGNIYKKG